MCISIRAIALFVVTQHLIKKDAMSFFQARCPETCNATATPCECYIDGWVDCERKNLRSIPATIPTCARNLLIKYNEIAHLGLQDFQGLTQLNNLEIQFEKITKLLPGTFADLSNLTVLDLSNNQIRSIDECAFEGLVSLYTLILSNNKITYIDKTAFDGLVNLDSISFYNNSINTLDIQWFQNKPNISRVLLSLNDWNCTCALKQNYTSIINSFSLIINCQVISNLFNFNVMCIYCQYPSAIRGKVLRDIPYSNFTNCTGDVTTSSPITTTAFVEQPPPSLPNILNDESYCQAKITKLKNAENQTTTVDYTSTSDKTNTEQSTTTSALNMKTSTISNTTDMVVNTTIQPQLGLPVWGICLIVAVALIITTGIILIAIMFYKNSKNLALSNNLTSNVADSHSNNFLNKSYETSPTDETL